MLKCKIVAIDPGIQRGSGFLPDPNEASEDPSKNPPQKILQLGIDFKNAEVKKLFQSIQEYNELRIL